MSLTVKLANGDVRHLSRIETSTVLFDMLSSKPNNAQSWFLTDEGAAVNGAHIVEVGDPDD